MKHDKCYWSPDYVMPEPFVKSKSDYENYICIDNLEESEKQILWREIKNKEPDLAQLMIDDTFNKFKKAFGAVHVIEQKKHNQLTDEGN